MRTVVRTLKNYLTTWPRYLYYTRNMQYYMAAILYERRAFRTVGTCVTRETCKIPISLMTYCSSTTLCGSFIDTFLGRWMYCATQNIPDVCNIKFRILSALYSHRLSSIVYL